ncbi:DUF1232 domain-containing protein [Methanobacterium alcaliphilum]|uniref:DUF1232 domain-containing protein n=1 Tax=Methanobacterium alcaliphilum TaxID=392018 RepID=UPI00200A52B1|nr:DUF1232 domain-containing protein [Methanobacterium alcaliphilum]MCK9151805.1 DUF1232 domain-containing protein [Methanobacterium alcaliphilum]
MAYVFKDFYELLKENLDSFEGEYDKFIDFGPDLFNLLTKLLNEEFLSSDDRMMVNSAIAYFVAPYDVIPEQIYGPYGYVDDIFISCYVLLNIGESYGFSLLEEIWDDQLPNLEETLNLCYNKSKKIVGKDKKEILRYGGLIE